MVCFIVKPSGIIIVVRACNRSPVDSSIVVKRVPVGKGLTKVFVV
jgi:hypothetical protein